MSGVGRHRPTRGEGDHPSCTNEERKDGDAPRVACFGLDGQGPQAPKNQIRKVSRRLSNNLREGWKPEGPRPRLPERDSARDSPTGNAGRAIEQFANQLGVVERLIRLPGFRNGEPDSFSQPVCRRLRIAGVPDNCQMMVGVKMGFLQCSPPFRQKQFSRRCRSPASPAPRRSPLPNWSRH